MAAFLRAWLFLNWPTDIPFSAESVSSQYSIDVRGQSLSIGALSMGNPHAILVVDDCDSAPVSGLGPLLECHERFPDRKRELHADSVPARSN